MTTDHRPRSRRRRRLAGSACALVLPFIACDGGGPTQPAPPGPTACGPYPPWESSQYVLPYPAGMAFVVSQGNCSIGSHQGPARHAYDFAMPVGTTVVATRDGIALSVEDRHPDGTGLPDDDNVITVEHADGTLARYVHIRQRGALVAAGDPVSTGQPIALSGNSGSTGGLPHLHFQVTPCPDRDACGTLAVTFRNTTPHPQGLVEGMTYPAFGG